MRPVNKASHTINVKVNFALTQILDMVNMSYIEFIIVYIDVLPMGKLGLTEKGALTKSISRVVSRSISRVVSKSISAVFLLLYPSRWRNKMNIIYPNRQG